MFTPFTDIVIADVVATFAASLNVYSVTTVFAGDVGGTGVVVGYAFPALVIVFGFNFRW